MGLTVGPLVGHPVGPLVGPLGTAPRPGTPINVLALSHDPQSSVAQIRLLRPLQLLVDAGALALRARGFHQLRRSDTHWADIVILQRATGARQLAAMGQWQAAGIPVIYEIDDLLTEPAEHLTQNDALRRAQPALRALLAGANRITASTAPLVDEMRACGPPVSWVPNGIATFNGPQAHHGAAGPISLIVASSDRQQLDALGDALAALLAPGRPRAADALAIDLWGVGPVAAALGERGLPHQVLPLLPPDRFLSTLARLANPVGLIPLDDSRFSGCKSTVKFLDYASAGIPSLCVDRPPYRGLVQHGLTGWLCADDAEGWRQGLNALCGSAELRSCLAQAARADALARHSLAQMAQAWQQVLNDTLRDAASLRPRQVAPFTRRTVDALADAIQAPVQLLRERNRQRLRRRQ